MNQFYNSCQFISVPCAL